MKDGREVIFAAWIANIHRFYESGAVELVRRHAGLLEHFLDVEYLLKILRREITCQEEWKVVEEARELSLCESEKNERTVKKRNLTSVFSRITVRDQEKAEKRYYPLEAETVDASFPIMTADEHGLKQMAEEFDHEFSSMERNVPESWENFIVIFDALTRKYLWCITASDYEGEDISLYNQSRIAAAIAACFCRCGLEKKERFKLVVGDFSGIQKYVFAVANVNNSGVAKRLRARSFYVDITVSVIAQSIIERFELTQNHILMLTGGKFYLLLPNIEGSDAILSDMEQKIGENFYHKFKGAVGVHLAWLSMGNDGLEYYSKSVTEIMRRLGDKKNQAFHQNLTADGRWKEDMFILEHDLNGKKVCPYCENELMDQEDKCCPNCRIQTEIGGKLPKTRYISYYRSERENAYHIYGNYWIGLWTRFQRDDAFLTERINYTQSAEEERGFPVKIRYMANHIPVDLTGEVMNFEDMSMAAKGVPKLAVLKADVDNLGYIFADGLRIGNRHFGTISRVNTMSRLLETFFSGYVNQVISQEKEFQQVYSVFSGGDDLFLIGPWDVMPKLAGTIEMQFHQFAACNPALTLSAAVSLFQPKEHIANMAELSEQTLKQVKNWPENISVKSLYPKKDGRDGVAFMGELYSWSDLKEQLEIGERLAGLLSKHLVDVGILRRIGIYSQMYRRFLNDKDVMGLMFEPLFHYDRQRNYDTLRDKGRKEPELQWFLESYVKDLAKNMADLRVIKKNLFFAEATVTYAMNLTKEERANGEL